jgi:pimeloyl-ACP methyl ester carboxylesterase
MNSPDEISRNDSTLPRAGGKPLPDSVAENPLLILLHGGPGFTETRLFRHFNAPIEQSFTVVYWEQRGTGKSFDDHVVEAGTSSAYFDVLTAPSKWLVWFEESAHEPPFEEPSKFNKAMVELVRPLAG